MVGQFRPDRREVHKPGVAADQSRSGGSTLCLRRAAPVPARTSGTRTTTIRFQSYRGYIYGVGIEWRPTERTNVVANWEHRFFGASYLFSFDHRTPLSVWSVSASRNITSYPQQLASLPAGNVQGILNQLFLSRIPDPTLRQNADRRADPGSGTAGKSVESGQPLYSADPPAGKRKRNRRLARSPQFDICDGVLPAPGADRRFRHAVAARPCHRAHSTTIRSRASM